MKKLTENPYDLLPVTLAGELLRTRPVEFEYDIKDGLPIAAIKYHSTCPKCSQLVEFSPDQIKVRPQSDSSRQPEYFVQGCEACPVPKDCVKLDSEPEINADEIGDIVDFNAFKQKLAASEAFVDPIVAGRLILDGAEPANG